MSNEPPEVFDLAKKTRPTRWDRRVLMLYKVYPSQQDIPDFVSRSKITFYRNKFRVHYSIATMILAGIGFFSVSYIGKRDLEANNKKLELQYLKQQQQKSSENTRK